MQDVRLAVRALGSTPIVTGVAVLSLALGIGANTAIFSILDGLLLRKLPVQEPDRLALVLSRDDARFFGWSYMLWNQIRQHREQVFKTAVAFSPTMASIRRSSALDSAFARTSRREVSRSMFNDASTRSRTMLSTSRPT